MTDYFSVRSNFVLGPLVLRVEKSFGRGAKRETKRATATTTQMIGRINLRVVGDKVTLHSIKVQQPKQVPHLEAIWKSMTLDTNNWSKNGEKKNIKTNPSLESYLFR